MVTRALIVRNGFLGDTLVFVPTLLELNRRFDEVEVLVPAQCADSPIGVGKLLTDLKLVSKVHVYDLTSTSLIRQAFILRDEFRGRFLAIYNFLPERSLLQFVVDTAFLKLVDPRAKLVTAKPFKLSSKSLRPYKRPAQIEWQRLLHFITESSADVSVEDFRAKYAVLPDTTDELTLNKTIFIAPGSTMPAKQWGTDRYEGLCIELLTHLPSIRIELVGGPEEFLLCQTICDAVGSNRLSNSVGNYSLLQLFSIARYASLFVGNDSGLLHLFGLMGCRTVGIYSARDSVNKWRPVGRSKIFRIDVECKGCMLNTCPHENMCTRAIQVDEVRSAICKFLHDGNSL